ncbi:MAG TPA: hypothetical protein VEL05_07260 [Candidatus Acidoferrum sp.]|nr:hypothetical protein [Candidatus Acidoferrum sp.]
MRARILLLVILAASCGRAPARPTAAAEPGIAPRPFTAEQIRAAMPVGTEIRFRVEESGKPVTILQWRVTAADEATMTMTARMLGEDGAVLAEEPATPTRWDELVGHATFPADRTTRTQGTVDLPAGRFDTIDYTVSETQGASKTVSAFHFARSLPGPPVLIVVEKDGTEVRRMTLLSRTPR